MHPAIWEPSASGSEGLTGSIVIGRMLRSVHLSRRALDLLCFVVGACVGAVGLLIVGDAGPGSWVVAPVTLGLGAVAQQRALFAPGGPFRT